MYQTSELVRERQQALLSRATQQSRGLRARALGRAARRADRAERRLTRSWSEALRLRSELEAELERALEDSACAGQR
jgi:hypothetical protein